MFSGSSTVVVKKTRATQTVTELFHHSFAHGYREREYRSSSLLLRYLSHTWAHSLTYGLADMQTCLLYSDEHAFTGNCLRPIPLSLQSYRHAFGFKLELCRGFNLIRLAAVVRGVFDTIKDLSVARVVCTKRENPCILFASRKKVNQQYTNCTPAPFEQGILDET